MIVVENLTKVFGEVTAIRDLNLRVQRGEIFGFIGPNGAGKTTTIKILATLLEPTSGDAYISDYSVTAQPYQVRKRIGYVPDFYGMYENLQVREYLEFFSRAYRLDTGRIEEVLELVKLKHKEHSFIAHLSRGMRQKLCLARALLHNPEVLILDEPASGLDPVARAELLEILKNLGRKGKTIFISSHILPEIWDVCTEIGVIREGMLVFSGKKEKLARGVERVYIARFISGRKGVENVLSRYGVDVIGISEKEARFKFKGEEKSLAQLVRELSEVAELVEFRAESSLDEAVLRIMGGGIEGTAQ